MRKEDFYEEDDSDVGFDGEIEYIDDGYSDEEYESGGYDDEYEDYPDDEYEYDDDEGGGMQILVKVMGVLIAIAVIVLVGIFLWQKFFANREPKEDISEAADEIETSVDDIAEEIKDIVLPEDSNEDAVMQATKAPTAEPTAAPTATEAPTETPTPTAAPTEAAAPTPKTDTDPNDATGGGNADAASDTMVFTDVNETVTAKNSTNLRDKPSQGDDSNVIYTLPNGESVTRTGISDSGWSRLTYNGSTVYAVSSYLTTDLNYKEEKTQADEDDGLNTKFTKVNEQVTPKIEVNLRKLPSVTNPDATVVATIQKGTVVTRTGINKDVGWSRVEYNGQTLYCVSSYMEAYTE